MYFLDYKVVWGQFRHKSLRNLPEPRIYIKEEGRHYPAHIWIPQPDGRNAFIETHDVTTASKMLGVHFSPAGTSTTHVDRMVERGLDWVERLRSEPLSRNDAWLSFYF